jgi:hypothetical protein
MAKAKMIKEVEVKFSPAFEKAINGVKTTKKAATKKAKTKTKKAVTKTKTKATKTRKAKATKPAAPKAPRGYKITKVVRELMFNKVKDFYEQWEVTGKGMPNPRYFISEEAAQRFVETLKVEDLQAKALAGKVHGGPMARAVVSEMKELAAQADLPELDTERPERCDKTSIEDIDA